MPKRRIAKGNARSLAQKRAQQKAAEASARARRKRGGDEPSARRAVARLDTNSPNNKRDVVALKEAVKGSTARGKLSLAASAKVGRENVINDADRIAYRASAAESRRLKVKLGDNAPTADKIFSTAKKIAKIREGNDSVSLADTKKAAATLDPKAKTPKEGAKVALTPKTDSQIIRSGSQYKDLDDATIKQAISNLVDKRDRTSGEEDRLKGLRAEQRRRSVNKADKKPSEEQLAQEKAARERRAEAHRAKSFSNAARGVSMSSKSSGSADVPKDLSGMSDRDLHNAIISARTSSQKNAYSKELAKRNLERHFPKGIKNASDEELRSKVKDGTTPSSVKTAIDTEIQRRSLGRSVNPDHRRVSKASDEKTIAGLSKWSVQDLRNRLESKNTSDQLKKAISAELDSRSKAEGGGSPRTKPAATPKSMTDARLRDEIKKAKPNSPELYDLQEELGDRDSASPQERRNAKAAMQAKSDLKRESRQSDPDLISSRNSNGDLPAANDAAAWANLIGSKQRREIAAMTPRQRANFKKQMQTSSASGRVSENVKASNDRSIAYIDALDGRARIAASKKYEGGEPPPVRQGPVKKAAPKARDGLAKALADGKAGVEIKATEIQEGDIIDLIHEVQSITKNKDTGLFEVKTKTFGKDASYVSNSVKRLYSDETVILNAEDKKKSPEAKKATPKKAAPSSSRPGVNEQIYEQIAKRELQKIESNRVRSVISSVGGSTAQVTPMDDESDYTYTSDGKVQHKKGGFVVILNDKPDLVSLRAKLENNGFEVSIDEPNSAHPKIVIVPKDDKDKK